MERHISILLVQPETPQGAELCRNLMLAGWQVTSVQHPRQAMAACALRRYDVVFIGHAPPTLDGIDLTKKLIRYASVPIVLLADDSTAEHGGREAGAIAYLGRPWLASDLYRTVNLALQTNMIGQL
jgi:DNA-binding response OmpR family regulator